MAPEDPKQLDPSEKSANGHGPTRTDQTQNTDSQLVPRQDSAATEPKDDTDDRWDESEIDAAVGVLERPSQIPVPSTRSPAPAVDPLEEVPHPRELRVSAPSASSVEKSRRSGAPAAGDTPQSSASSKSNAPESSSTKATPVDETEEPTHYYERSRLVPNPTTASPKEAPESEEDTRYYERSSAKAGTDEAEHASESSKRASGPNVSLPIGVRGPSDPKPSSPPSGTARAENQGEQRPPAQRANANASSGASRTEPEAEEPTTFYERPSLAGKSTSSSQPSPRPAATQAWNLERQSSISLGVGVGVLSSDGESRGAITPNIGDERTKAQTVPRPPDSKLPSSLQPLASARELGRAKPPTAPDPQRQPESARKPTMGALPESERKPAVTSNAADLASRSPTTIAPDSRRPTTAAAVTESGRKPAAVASSAADSARGASSPMAPNFGTHPPTGVTGMPASFSAALPSPDGAGAPPSALSSEPVAGQGPPLTVPARAVEAASSAASGIVQSRSSELDPASERSDDGPGVGYFDYAGPGGLTGVTAFTLAPRTGGADADAEPGAIVPRAVRRLLSVTVSCVFAALALAPLEAWFAQRASAERVSALALTGVCAGLMVPVALAVAVAAMGLSVMLHPEVPPSIARLPKRLRPSDVRRRSRLAVILGLSPLGICAWVLLSARAALPLLGANVPPEMAGTLLAVAALGLALVIAAPILAAARYVGVRLRRDPPDPVRWAIVGLVLGVLPLVYSITTGPTSGAGSMWAIFGVFKRPELDLRAPSMLFAILLAGYLLPSRLSRLPWMVLLGMAVLPWGLTYATGSTWLDQRAVSLAIERGAPISASLLPLGRRLTDGDRDGFGRGFGGGDCDDHNATRNPAADDAPGNGLDEDCSGADSVGATSRKLVETPAEVLRERRAVIPQRLNLILIIVDTMRADVLRHPKRVTPRIDELCARSAVLNNAYAPASYTGKSVGPLLIGKHSSETNRDFAHFSAFSKKDTFVQQRLQAAGIRTLSVQGYWYFHQAQYGFDRGFDVVDAEASTAAGYVEGDRSSTSEKLTERILAQLEQASNTDGRFFLWSQYTDPHAEYVWHKGFEFGPLSIDKYRGEVAFVDHQIGRILDFLRGKPWGERTAVVITSDHGEAFGEHAMIRHGFELWEPLVRVPLVIHVPGVGARQIESRRSVIDLVPTILDLMQVKMPEGTGTDFVSGQSLLPEILGIETADQPRPVLIDMAQGPYTSERQAYIDGSLKLITAQGRPIGLFDLARDPEEKSDLLDNAELRERVVGEYRAYKQTLRTVEVKPKP